METESTDYEPGIDQNQGVVGTMARHQQHGDTELEGTQKPELDPNRATNKADNAVEEDEGDSGTGTIGEQEFVSDGGTD